MHGQYIKLTIQLGRVGGVVQCSTAHQIIESRMFEGTNRCLKVLIASNNLLGLLYYVRIKFQHFLMYPGAVKQITGLHVK